MSDMNYTQQVVLAITPKVTALLSVLGSSWIVVEVLTQPSKRNNVYNRLLCAMSFFDIMSSIAIFASTWPIPKEIEGIAFAAGNEKTCIAQGFLIQAGIITPFYNFCLALYYMLVVKYKVSEQRLKHNFEAPAHLFCVGAAFLPAIAGVFLELYNEANIWCWIASVPKGCLNSITNNGVTTCIRGDNAFLYRWAFYYGPLWLVILVVTLIMLFVYGSVRQQAVVSKGHAHNKTREGKRSSFIVEILQEHAAGRKTKRGSIFEKIVLKESGVATRTRKVTKTQFVNGIPDQSAGTKREEGSSSNTFMIPNPVVDALDTPSVGADDADIDYVLNTIEKYTSATHQTMDVQRFGSQIVFRQSVLYTLAFYVSFTFATINRLVSQVSGETYFALLFLHVLLLPLQGFFNIFVYRYGFYLRLKQRHPEMTQWELCRHTYRWTFLGPPPGSTTVRSTVYESTNSHNNNNNPKIGRMATHTGSRNISGDIDSLQRSVILEDSDEASMPDDGLGTIHLEDFVADMMYSYSEFPNTVANDDTEVVIRSYPTMVEDFSSVNFTSME